MAANNLSKQLPQLHIANPCPMRWEELDGDDRKRFCDQCQKHVLNFSQMPTHEIRNALAGDRSVCAQIQHLADGTLITADSSRTGRSWLRRASALAAAVLGIMTFGGCDEAKLRQWLPFFPPPVTETPEIRGEIELGDVAIEPGAEMGGVRMLGQVKPQPPDVDIQ